MNFNSVINPIAFLLSALLMSIIILGYVGLFKWEVTSVATDVVGIRDISQMEDGKIVYYCSEFIFWKYFAQV